MSPTLFRQPRLFLISCAFFILATMSARAADHPAPWNSPHFSIDPKVLYSAASEASPPEGANIIVLDDEDIYSFDENGRCVYTSYTVFKVLTQKGVEGWDRISVGWQPWNGERPIIRARVITPDYAVHGLDPKTITDAPAGGEDSNLYTDRRVVKAPLPAIAPGSVVEEEFVLVSTPQFPGSGTVGRRSFGPVGVPVQHHLLVLDAPSSFPLQYVLQMLPDLKPQRSEANGRVKVVFEYSPSAPLEEADDYLPSGELGYPTVLFSAGTTWQRVVEGYGQIVESVLQTAQVKSLVEKLTHGKSSPNDKEQAILAFLDKEIRYTGIEFAENSIIPHPTAETLSRKYGDCKDKALLLVAMLRAAKIPAYMALLNTGRAIGVLPDLPGMGMFDHAIVYVPGEPDRWIDPTDKYERVGQLPIDDQGRSALIVRAGTRALVRTPEDSSQANVLLEFPEIHLAENGPARVVESTQPRGSFESGFRRTYTDRQDKKSQENLANYVKSQYLADKLDRWDRSDPADLSRPFELVLECSKGKRGFTELDSAGAAIRLEHIFNMLPDELQEREKPEDKAADASKPKKKRTADYQLPVAFIKEWQYKIIPPLGFQPGPLPHDAKISLGPALLTEQFSADSNGVVHADIRFDTVKRRFTVAEATDLRNKVAELEAGEAILINFQPLGIILQKQGKMRESFQSYRDLIAQHPKEAVHHLQIAQALLEAGMGEAARNEARLAVKLEPDSALAEKTLANILEYDLVGRRFRPGSDYAGAAAAFCAAAKLDPDDKAIVGNLAILLEYNEDGLRYGPGAKLQDAVTEYRKLAPEELANLGLKNNLAYALFYAGEFAEARQYAETLNPQPKALIVACEAAQNGSEAGMKEANKRTSGDVEIKQTLRAAGDMLKRLRKYSLVADLWQAGASGDGAARTMALAAIFRKARRHEELQFHNDPKDVALKYFLISMDPNETIEMLNGVLSKNAQAVLKNTDPEEIEKDLKEGMRRRRKWARDGDLWDITVDFMLQGTEPKGEGNDAVGYREKLQIPDWKQMTVFVVKEDGQYKVLDTSEQPNAIGLEILDRIAAHDLDGAKALLDWLREEKHLSGGDDPLAGVAFPRFWTKGKDADAHQMRLAAAAILVLTKSTARQGLSILEEGKKSARGDVERTNINVALRDGYSTLHDYQKLLGVCLELAKDYPESESVFFIESTTLRALGRFDKAQALAQQRLTRIPDDSEAILAMMRNAIAQEDYLAAYNWGHKLVDIGKASAIGMNDFAWLTLFFARPEGPDIDLALKSSQMRQNDTNILHTLGCLYAEVGKTKEAHDVLVQAMDLRDLDEPDPDFWYAFGRIAEQYGEREIALADYAKVTKPKLEIGIPDSTYRLAQNRLKVLQNNPPRGGASTQP
jgi:tetratricopeptide (TPR) repeat protein/transglutaminase-like putative cysteine protease